MRSTVETPGLDRYDILEAKGGSISTRPRGAIKTQILGL